MSPYRLPDSLLEQLLLEDTPYGDATSFALGLSQHQGVMHCVARYDMVLASPTPPSWAVPPSARFW